MFDDISRDLEGPERLAASLENPTQLVDDGHPSIRLVDSDRDPRITTDGGRNLPSHREFELTLEYTTMDGRRRRVTYVPDADADDDARRITYERHDGEWRENSRQLISKLAVHLETDPGQSGGHYPGP